MAVLVTWTTNYIGISADDKPAPVLAGSKFLESDTQKVFIFTGTTWVELTAINF